MSDTYFPVTASHTDYGTTMRRYLFNESAAPAVDGSVNSSNLILYSATPSWGENGYGAEVKSDATDLAFKTLATNTALIESAASTTQQNTTAMTVEVIAKMDNWGANWGCALSCINPASRGSHGYEIAIGYSATTLVQAGFDGSGQWANRKFGSSYTAFPISAGDWVALWLIWNSAETGDSKIRLFGGNLSTPTTNVVESTSISGTPTGFAAASAKLAVGGRNNGTLSRSGTYISSLRIQDAAFTSTIVQARYDAFKGWGAGGGGGSQLFNGIIGRTRIIGG